MDAKTLEIIDSSPAIDKVVAVVVGSLHRAASENQTGNVEFSVPLKDGTIIKPPKEVIVIFHK